MAEKIKLGGKMKVIEIGKVESEEKNKQEFRQGKYGREVRAAVDSMHVYHEACAPKDATMNQWIRTRGTACHGCGQPIYKTPKKDPEIKLISGWSHSDTVYARIVLEADADRKEEWLTFAGTVLMIGIEEGISIDMIIEYIFETFHGLSYEEIPETIEGLRQDIKLYVENYIDAEEEK